MHVGFVDTGHTGEPMALNVLAADQSAALGRRGCRGSVIRTSVVVRAEAGDSIRFTVSTLSTSPRPCRSGRSPHPKVSVPVAAVESARPYPPSAAP